MFGSFAGWLLTRTTTNAKTQAETKRESPLPISAPSSQTTGQILGNTDEQKPKGTVLQRQKASGHRNNQQQQSNSGGTNNQQSSSGNNSPNVSQGPHSSAKVNSPQVNAPNGIAIGGNNLGTATVNNFGDVTPPPRTLTDDELEKLISALAVNNRPMTFIEIVDDKDGESNKFGRQVVSAFEKSWQVELTNAANAILDVYTDAGVMKFHGEGLHCMSNDPQSALLAQVVAAFNSIGLTCKTDIPFGVQHGADVAVVIGRR